MTRISLLLFFVLALTGCGSSQEDLVENAPLISVSFTDDLGREIKLPKTPEKIISLSPNTTEIIFAIGAGDLLVARSEICNYPEETDGLPKIKIDPEPDLPDIVLYEADLVIASDETMDSTWVGALSRLRVPVFFQSYETTEDIYRNMKSLGEILGRKEEAVRYADSLKRIEDRIVEATKNEIKYATMVLLQMVPPAVAGRKSFIHDLILKAGGKNSFAALDGKYLEIDPQDIMTANPEFIIFPSRSQADYGKFIAAYPGVSYVDANVNSRVFILEPEILIRPGPRSIEGLATLTRCLHSKINIEELME